MKDYIIFTDATADLATNQIDELNINVLPMEFAVDSISYKHYPDERELLCKSFYGMLRDGRLSTTSQINVSSFIDAFEGHLKSGKDVLYIAFSSGLSGTYASAVAAAKELSEKYIENKVVVVDSLCASGGEGLLVYLAATKKKDGLTLDELFEFIEQIKLKVCQWFTVNDLFHLKRGGRLSSVGAVMGTVMGVKPVLRVDDTGHLIPIHKVRGRAASLKKLAQEFEDSFAGENQGVIFITHADALEEAESLGDLVKGKFSDLHVVITAMGPVIGTHAGPGAVGIFFVGK